MPTCLASMISNLKHATKNAHIIFNNHRYQIKLSITPYEKQK
jgi:hypothetical protein